MKMKHFILVALSVWAACCTYAQQNLTAEHLWKMGRISDIRLSPDGKDVLFAIAYYDLQANKGNNDIYKIPSGGGTPVRLTEFPGPDFHARWRPDGKKIGYLSASSGEVQLWEMEPDGGNKKQITAFKGGITGFDYMHDQKYLIVTREVKMDQTVHDRYPDLPLADAMVFDDLMYRHWDSWTDYTYSHIFLVPYNAGVTGEPVDIMQGERFSSPVRPFGGMEQISATAGKIAYTSQKLNGKEYALSTNSDIYVYDMGSGQTENISTGMNGYDMDPVFSRDGKKIVWWSMETPGFESDKKRIMLYDFETKKTTDLSAGFDQSSAHLVWSLTDPDVLYFISGTRATFQVYSLNIRTKKIDMLSRGVHDYTDIAAGPGFLIGTKMSMSQPTEIFRLDLDATGVKEAQVSFVNKQVLSEITMGKVEERWITTSDGKKMLVWVIYPPGFDATRKYPALLYCQGGPQSAVSQFWSYRWNFQMMAAHGYIVVAPNRRGLPSFGQDWNDQISGDYGGQNMLDYLAAIDSLAKEPFVDETRLGALGASYGGFSVYWLAGNHNKRFKAFIAHCGMFNFESWYASTEEYWFPNHDIEGPYWNNPRPKSYDFSPHRFVGNWDTPLLVIHGQNDFRIPYTEGMQAFNAAQLRGVPSRFLFFPGESHFVTRPQNAVLWQREFFRWLDQWLK
jgi:dipeptidyl aminopeptidase/acylaminoacyl peptidase